MPLSMQFLVQMSFSFMGTIGYALCVNIPRKALIGCGMCGMFGWLVYWLMWDFLLAGKVSSRLIAPLVIGLVRYIFAKYKKMPVTLVDIPSLLFFVPGGTA